MGIGNRSVEGEVDLAGLDADTAVGLQSEPTLRSRWPWLTALRAAARRLWYMQRSSPPADLFLE